MLSQKQGVPVGRSLQQGSVNYGLKAKSSTAYFCVVFLVVVAVVFFFKILLLF